MTFGKVLGYKFLVDLKNAKIHFVGIGGIGMSGIAEVLVNMGCAVSGSDLGVNAQVERLKSLGARVFQGHTGANVPESCHAVVFSSAVKASNPEILEARARKIPVIQRAEMLAELMRLRRGIAIGGTHGKTTTTSMVATMMIHAHLDPTIVVGGRLDLIKSSASLGKGQWLVAEADESDGSFLKLSPEIVVVTNIDNDHMDHYSKFEYLQKAFLQFTSLVPFYGVAVMCADDPTVLKISKNISKRVVLYGFSKSADLRAENVLFENGRQKFDVSLNGVSLGQVLLQVPGRHNVLNSLAALAVGLELGLSFDEAVSGLGHYSGVDRRLQKIGEINRVEIYDDYGHHPTEVRSTLLALRELFPDRRLVVAFQPHRYTRTKDCWKEFLKCFDGADVLGFLDIYAASEKKIAGIDSKKLAAAVGVAMRKGSKSKGSKGALKRSTVVASSTRSVVYWGAKDRAVRELGGILKPGDVFLTLGAGDVYKLGQELLKVKKS